MAIFQVRTLKGPTPSPPSTVKIKRRPLGCARVSDPSCGDFGTPCRVNSAPYQVPPPALLAADPDNEDQNLEECGPVSPVYRPPRAHAVYRIRLSFAYSASQRRPQSANGGRRERDMSRDTCRDSKHHEIVFRQGLARSNGQCTERLRNIPSVRDFLPIFCPADAT